MAACFKYATQLTVLIHLHLPSTNAVLQRDHSPDSSLAQHCPRCSHPQYTKICHSRHIKEPALNFTASDVLLSALCNSRMRLSRGAVLHTMSKRAKFSHPTHNIWRWLPTMYIPSVNPVCLTLVPSDLSLSIR